MKTVWRKQAWVALAIVLMAVGCGQTATPAPPTPAPTRVVKATALPEPTLVPPTPTPVPPTPTPVPPTPTSVPPTSTPIPPTPTAMPLSEAPAGSIEDVVGTWRGRWSDVALLNMQLNEAGSSRWFWMDGTTIVRDRFSLESGQITWRGAQGTAVGGECAADPVATYEVFITKEGSQPVALRLMLVGQDHCPDRQEFLDGRTLKWVEP